jgi:hypothetical protein
MIVNKCTVGYVSQLFDTTSSKWKTQDFIAGSECTIENEDGESVEWPEEMQGSNEPYLPFLMKEPEDMGQTFSGYGVFYFPERKPDDDILNDTEYVVMVPDEVNAEDWTGFSDVDEAIKYRDELREENPTGKYEVIKESRTVIQQ